MTHKFSVKCNLIKKKKKTQQWLSPLLMMINIFSFKLKLKYAAQPLTKTRFFFPLDLILKTSLDFEIINEKGI